MCTPNYNDLGKKVKDIFDKNFPAGFVKLNANLPKVQDIGLNISGSQNIDSGKLVSSVDTKMNFNLANKNILLTEKWTTSNEVQSILEISATDNLSSIIELNFEPSSGRKSIKFKNNYATEIMNSSAELEFRQIEPIVTISSVFKIIRSTSLFGGSLVSFDTFKQKFAKIAYGIEYSTDKTCLTGTISNHNEILLQACHRVLSNTDFGIEGSWNMDSKAARYGIAVKHDINDDNSFKMKLQHCGNLSLGYTFLAREGLKLTFGCKLDCRNINGGGHKLGLQLEV